MLLTFMRHFPDKEPIDWNPPHHPEIATKDGRRPTLFKQKIQQGQKIHTIRKRKGNLEEKIHFWENSPRNPSTDPEPFYIHPNSEAGLQVPLWIYCDRTNRFVPQLAAIEVIEIDFYPRDCSVDGWPAITIGGKPMSSHFFTLCKNDGLTAGDFIKFFQQQAKKEGKTKITRYIKHWTLKCIYNAQTAEISPKAIEAGKIKI